ncbi:MAG: Bug family tripartite tricarboxylate transporter substrate binding protein [Lautropia sp.]
MTRPALVRPASPRRAALATLAAGAVTAAAMTAAALAGLAPAAAVAQTYPDKPLRLIVPYPPGGNNDVVARLFGQKLSEALGQPVVVDNRGGAAGSIGMGLAAKAAPDGYTLVIGDIGTLAINRYANPNLSYDPRKDFAPISLLANVSILMTARPDFPADTFAEFLKLARANPGKYSYASGGAGDVSHLSMEMLRSMAGIDLRHVPYKGGAPAVTDLIGGHVDVLINGAAFAAARAGKLKAFAVTGDRIAAMPNLPTIAEAGVPGFRFTNWWGFLFPAGTPAPIVEQVSAALQKIAAAPDVRERLAEAGITAGGSTPQAFAELVRSEDAKIGKIVQDSKIVFQ